MKDTKIFGIFTITILLLIGFAFISKYSHSKDSAKSNNIQQVNNTKTVSNFNSDRKSNTNLNADSSQSIEKSFTLSEIATHNKATDCWMAIDNKVYDVTSYVYEHPGGSIILNGCGTDATFSFNSVRKHSGSASSMLQNFYIGDLKF